MRRGCSKVAPSSGRVFRDIEADAGFFSMWSMAVRLSGYAYLTCTFWISPSSACLAPSVVGERMIAQPSPS